MSRNITRILMSSAILSGLVALQGCNTWKGFGKDVEDTGKNIQGDKSSDQSTSDSATDPDEGQGGG